eukprot:Gb_10957 [translate_table: standard]
MQEMYTEATRLWAELRVELMRASSCLYDERPNLSQLWRLYWASHQRFFRHMCMSAKVPAAVRLAKQALSEDKCVVIGLQSTGEARTEEAVTKYGAELDDFVSGPRELLLKLVEENYPLPQQPSHTPEEEGVKEFRRKRHSAPTGVSFKGRMRKAARCKAVSDADSDGEFETESEHESADSDEEFQICDICITEDVRKNAAITTKELLRCSCCRKSVHPICLVPPEKYVSEGNWSCPTCKEQTAEYLQSRHAYIAELWKRYETAKKRKTELLEIIRTLNLPNNPLDDIIDQLHPPHLTSAHLTPKILVLAQTAINLDNPTAQVTYKCCAMLSKCGSHSWNPRSQQEEPREKPQSLQSGHNHDSWEGTRNAEHETLEARKKFAVLGSQKQLVKRITFLLKLSEEHHKCWADRHSRRKESRSRSKVIDIDKRSRESTKIWRSDHAHDRQVVKMSKEIGKGSS